MQTNPEKIKKTNSIASNVESDVDLLRKELSLNLQEQTLLKQRLALLTSELNATADFDPEYISALIQIDMDRIELNELKTRELSLSAEVQNRRETAKNPEK